MVPHILPNKDSIMKAYKTITTAVLVAFLAGPALAQSNQNMQDTDGMQTMRMAQATQPIIGKGTVKKVDAGKKTVSLNHEAIPAIGWPAMTMDFQVAPGVDLSKVQSGQPVSFGLEKGSDGNYTVTSIASAGK